MNKNEIQCLMTFLKNCEDCEYVDKHTRIGFEYGGARIKEFPSLIETDAVYLDYNKEDILFDKFIVDDGFAMTTDKQFLIVFDKVSDMDERTANEINDNLDLTYDKSNLYGNAIKEFYKDKQNFYSLKSNFQIDIIAEWVMNIAEWTVIYNPFFKPEEYSSLHLYEYSIVYYISKKEECAEDAIKELRNKWLDQSCCCSAECEDDGEDLCLNVVVTMEIEHDPTKRKFIYLNHRMEEYIRLYDLGDEWTWDYHYIKDLENEEIIKH